MPKPTVRILLPPRPSSDDHTDSPTSPRTVRIYRRPSSGPSYYAEYAHSTDPSPPLTITIRRRSSDREDKRWGDSRPSSTRSRIPYTSSSSAAAPPTPSLPSPGSSIRHEHEHPRPSSASASAALSTRGPQPTPAAPPAPSSATSSASSHSRRSSQASSDYLYGQDYAYGAEPLRLRAARPPGGAAGIAVAIRGTGPEGSAAARRRVRFVTHYP